MGVTVDLEQMILSTRQSVLPATGDDLEFPVSNPMNPAQR